MIPLNLKKKKCCVRSGGKVTSGVKEAWQGNIGTRRIIKK